MIYNSEDGCSTLGMKALVCAVALQENCREIGLLTLNMDADIRKLPV